MRTQLLPIVLDNKNLSIKIDSLLTAYFLESTVIFFIKICHLGKHIMGSLFFNKLIKV